MPANIRRRSARQTAEDHAGAEAAAALNQPFALELGQGAADGDAGDAVGRCKLVFVGKPPAAADAPLTIRSRNTR